MPQNDALLEEVYNAMLRIQARPRGCKLQEIADEVDEINTKQTAKHYADLLVEEGRVIKEPGAGGLRALTEEEQAALDA